MGFERSLNLFWLSLDTNSPIVTSRMNGEGDSKVEVSIGTVLISFYRLETSVNLLAILI